MDIISSVGYSRSDSVTQFMMDGRVHIRGTGVVLQVPRDNDNPVGKMLKSKVDHIALL
jgi:hypothetical protein